jgi:hypothetical protein
VVVPLEATVPGRDGAPTVHLVFDEVDRRLECREVLLTADPAGREIRKSDLRAVGIDAARDEVMTIWSAPWETTQVTEGRITFTPAGWLVKDRVAAGVSARRSLDRSRRRLTEADLRRIAEIYTRDATGAPTRAVAEAFDVKHRTAVLYVHKARHAGLIPPVGAGKAGGKD